MNATNQAEHQHIAKEQTADSFGYLQVTFADAGKDLFTATGILTGDVFTRIDSLTLTKAPFTNKSEFEKFYIKNPSAPLFIKVRNPVISGNVPYAELAPVLHKDEKLKNALTHTASLTPAQRIEQLKDLKSSVIQKLKEDSPPEEKIKITLDAGAETFITAKTALEQHEAIRQNFSGKNHALIKKNENIPQIIRCSREILDLIVQDLSGKKEIFRMLSKLEDYAEGNTLGHIKRVMTHTVQFMNYINFNIARGLREKLKPLFAPGEKYSLFYKVPYNQVLNERLRPFTSSEIQNASIAALLHDVGKIADIDYFDSGKSYNKDLIELHVLRGYNLLSHSGEFSSDVLFAVGAHHEYRDHHEGYGIKRDFYRKLARGNNSPPQYCLSYYSEDAASGKAHEYIINALITVVDVFDALICSRRKYRDKGFTEKEALSIMKNMTLKEGKLDCILYDLFVSYAAADISNDPRMNEFQNTQLFKVKGSII